VEVYQVSIAVFTFAEEYLEIAVPHIVTSYTLISHLKCTCLTELFKFIEAVATPDLEVGFSRIKKLHTVYPSAIPDLGIRICHCIEGMFNKVRILASPLRDVMCKCGS
jgi:hypothetical protein